MTDATCGALLLIDFGGLRLPGGRMEVEQGQIPSVIAAAQRAVEEAQDHDDLIVKIGNEFPARRSDWQPVPLPRRDPGQLRCTTT